MIHSVELMKILYISKKESDVLQGMIRRGSVIKQIVLFHDDTEYEIHPTAGYKPDVTY